jgi:ribonuclease HI
MNLLINTDGASRGNPGLASYGFVIIDKETGEAIHKAGKTLGINTNNVAEYSGVLGALEYVSNNLAGKAPHQIEVVADSQLIIRQLAGFYKIKNERLKEIFNQIKALEIELGMVRYRHVLREFNKEADRLANLALDKK